MSRGEAGAQVGPSQNAAEEGPSVNDVMEARGAPGRLSNSESCEEDSEMECSEFEENQASNNMESHNNLKKSGLFKSSNEAFVEDFQML